MISPALILLLLFISTAAFPFSKPTADYTTVTGNLETEVYRLKSRDTSRTGLIVSLNYHNRSSSSPMDMADCLTALENGIKAVGHTPAEGILVRLWWLNINEVNQRLDQMLCTRTTWDDRTAFEEALRVRQIYQEINQDMKERGLQLKSITTEHALFGSKSNPCRISKYPTLWTAEIVYTAQTK